MTIQEEANKRLKELVMLRVEALLREFLDSEEGRDYLDATASKAIEELG